MFAQAMVERGMLESASLGISSLVTGIGDVAQAQPYLTILLAVVLGFLLIRRR
jgi:hypothetical protein